MLGDWSVDPECYSLEPPESKYDRTCTYPECDGFCSECETTSRKNEVVQKMGKHEHSEIQSGKIMVNVCDTPHDEERNIMQRPSKKGYLSDVQEVLPFICIHVSIFPLLPE